MVLRNRYLHYLKLFIYIFLFACICGGLYLFVKNNVLLKVENKIALLVSEKLYGKSCFNVQLIGVERANLTRIHEFIKNFCERELQLTLAPLFNDIKSDIWIKELSIRRKLPFTIEIFIKEYQPFAILNEDGILKLINETGHHITIPQKELKFYNNLIEISGNGAREHITSLFNLLSLNFDLYQQIRSISRIGKRRWNFELSNGILVKMPEEEHIVYAWENLDKILQDKNANITLKTIDLRDTEKTFLEWR